MNRYLFVMAGLTLLGGLATNAAQASSLQTLYSFSGGADGDAPYGKPLLDNKGALYGTTLIAGPNGGGTVFKLELATGTLTTLAAFTLAGATGSEPVAGVIFGKGGVLYGMTSTGGDPTNCTYGCGTAFVLNPANGALTTLATFSGLADGRQPNGQLIAGKSGMLYGTTSLGGYISGQGALGFGTVFQLNPKTKTLTTLHQFSVGSTVDGAYPEAALVADSAGILYGTASGGGPNNSGVVFAIDPVSSNFTLLHAFSYSVDGYSPSCTLLLHAGLLYGTTYAGGPTDAADGTIFSVSAATSQFATLYSFTGGTDGLRPSPGVALGKHGKLYGTTNQGGSSGAGTAYSLTLTKDKYALVHDFDINDGVAPTGGLTVDKSGAIYGVTSGGGRGHGTVFKITP
jgi:uncharacterized repeat protein (TIGR03803 family)